jgi:urease accessory protein
METTLTHNLAQKGVQRAILLGFLMVALAAPAAAHHPLGGATPETAWHGLLSGFGHPVLGFDHLAFVIAVGVTSAFVGLRYAAPAIFIGATLVGCLAVLNFGQPFAQLEMMISASVALIGIMVMSGRSIATPVYVGLFAIAGLCHGGAYAGAMVGAEPTPIVAYLVGLGIAQYVIAATMTWITLSAWQASSTAALQPRLAGAVVAGVGLTFLLEHVEKLAFGV